jgi:hypothetical protein
MNARILIVSATITWLGATHSWAQNGAVPAQFETRLKEFFREKEAQARALAKADGKEQMPKVRDFFSAGREGDWSEVASIYRELRKGAYQYENTKSDPRLETMAWQPINEGYGVYEQCAKMEEKYVAMFAREVLGAMPRGSIYFGGTDPGRWIPTGFSKSHVKGDPVFVLTQNALADGLYLDYVRSMYGKRMVVPTEKDSQEAFSSYMSDAQQRLKEGKLKPGEVVKEANGKVNVSGQTAVMAINALLAKKIFEANPQREFFIEESFPLEWMYPHLTPQGLIMKINRQPLERIPEDVVRKDEAYWIRLVNEALGKWLAPTTSVEVVCDFAQRTFGEQQPDPFKPDEKFVNNEYASKTYSKLRSSQAGVYAWRAKNSKSAEEKERMTQAADFAFRQAFALCPYSPEAVFRYVGLLVEQNRNKDALLVAQTASNIRPSTSFANLVREMERLQ